MLGYLRKNTQSWFAQGILILIAVVFIFFFGCIIDSTHIRL